MKQNLIEIVTGRKGEGKSSLSYHRARLARRGVAIFDPNIQFTIGAVVHDQGALLEALAGTETPVVFQPLGDVSEGFVDFQEGIFTKRQIVALVDEASLLGSPQRIDPALDRLIRLSRTKEIDVILDAHRPQDLNGIVFSLADFYCFFHTTHPRDLERIESFTSAKARARVEQLGQHEFLCWSVATESFYVNTDPKGWREEISPEPEGEFHEEEVLDHGREH
jgi:hypothetical protein